MPLMPWRKLQAGLGGLATNIKDIRSTELVAASIFTNMLKDGIITDVKVTSLDAAKITTGYLSVDRLEAGTIAATKLSFSAFNKGVDDLDDISNGGTYGKLRNTDISSGHLQLTSSTVVSGEWYNESGVEIDATTGINIYGTANALTTRATKTGTIQCYVGADGAIYAGAGAVAIDATGITINEQVLSFTTGEFTTKGIIGYNSGASRLEFASSANEDIAISAGDDIYLLATGNIVYIGGHIEPTSDITYDIGSGNNFRSIYATNFYGTTIRANTIYPTVSAASYLGNISYYWDFALINNIKTDKIFADASTSWIGGGTYKFDYGYFNNLPACPVPTSYSALEVIKKIKSPKIMTKGKHGNRHYFEDEDFPDEMKCDAFTKSNDGVRKKTGEKEIEFIRTIGVLVQSVRELAEKVESLEGKLS